MAVNRLDRVLLIEEDPEVGIALSVLLAAAGYGVATTFQDATAVLEVDTDYAEVGLLRDGDPESSGEQLADGLRNRLGSPLITDAISCNESRGSKAEKVAVASPVVRTKPDILRKSLPNYGSNSNKVVA